MAKDGRVHGAKWKSWSDLVECGADAFISAKENGKDGRNGNYSVFRFMVLSIVARTWPLITDGRTSLRGDLLRKYQVDSKLRLEYRCKYRYYFTDKVQHLPPAAVGPEPQAS